MRSAHPRWFQRSAIALLGALTAFGSGLLAPPMATADDPGVAAAAEQHTAGDIPGVDEVSSSPNMYQVGHVDKQPPFDTSSSFGTDIAFFDDKAVVGNYDGFVIYDLSNPKQPEIISQVFCPGPQNDVSVSKNLLFLSTDSSRDGTSCQNSSQPASEKDSWEGIKVFDISDLSNPRYMAAVETDCGSHTNTFVPDKAGTDAYIYVSSYSPSSAFPDCQPPHDKISVVKVPYADPASASIASEPVLFDDGGNGGDDTTSTTTGCHDITVFPEKDLAAGACMGDGVLMDISDREQPTVIDQVRDNQNFAFWHSATFNDDASKVVFTDELGGGGAPTCNDRIGPTRGADGIYRIVGDGSDRKLEFRSYFKIPRPQADTENCVAHNGSLIPVEGRDIMVQAWYQGGVSVWEFTDSEHPTEIGYWERGPLSNETLQLGGSWSAYYYNGHIYSSDIQKGLDVLDVRGSGLSKAKFVRMDQFNPQTQYQIFD